MLNYHNFNMFRAFTGLFLSLITIFATLFFASPVFAGGGPVDVEVYPLRPFDQTKTFIIQANIYAKEPCDTLKVNVALKPFKDSNFGDSISQFTPPADGTYINKHYSDGSAIRDICTTYYQVKSEISFQRTAVITAVVNGETETREVPVSFGTDEFSRQLQSFGRVNDYDNTPQPDIISQTYMGGPKRNVEIQWQKIPWAQKYTVFGAEVVDNVTQPYHFLATTSGTKTTISVAVDSAFYLRVIACKNADEACDNSNANSYSVMLDAMRDINQQDNQPEITETQIPQQITINQNDTDITSPVIEDKRVEELNKKVASLEAQVQQSQKKQSVLEERIASLVSFIKSLFPFFK